MTPETSAAQQQAKYTRLREAAQDFYSEWRENTGLDHDRAIEAVVGVVKEALDAE